MGSFIRLAPVAVVLPSAVPAFADTIQYRVEGLGNFGGRQTSGAGITDSGQVVGMGASIRSKAKHSNTMLRKSDGR